MIGLGLSPRGNDQPTATSNVSTSPVRFLAALGAWYRSSGRTLPLMDGLSFHPYPDQAIDPIDRGYRWPKAGFANLDRIKQSIWDAFRDTPQPTTVNGLKLYLDEVGWQVDTSALPGYTGSGERPRHRRCRAGQGLQRASSAMQPATPRSPRSTSSASTTTAPAIPASRRRSTTSTARRGASAASVQAAITQSAAGCALAGARGIPAKHVIGAVAPTWSIEARQVIRFDAAAAEGADVVACLLPGRLGGVAAAAAMRDEDRREPRLSRRQGDATAPCQFHVATWPAAAARHGCRAPRRRDEHEAVDHVLPHAALRGP